MCNKLPACRGTHKRCAPHFDVQHARCARECGAQHSRVPLAIEFTLRARPMRATRLLRAGVGNQESPDRWSRCTRYRATTCRGFVECVQQKKKGGL